MTSLKLMVQNGVARKPMDKWPAFDGTNLDRSAFVTASEVGKCLRMVWYGKRGDPAPMKPDNWGFWERGHNVEAWVVEQLLRGAEGEGVTFKYTGKDQVSFHHGDQSGTPDGVMYTMSGVHVLDIKSIDPRKRLSALPDKSHVMQVQQNIDLVEHCLGIDVVGGILLYVNASQYTLMYEHTFDRDETVMAELELRAATVRAAENAEDLPPEGSYNNGCTYCDYKALCSGAEEKRQLDNRNAKAQKEIAKDVFG